MMPDVMIYGQPWQCQSFFRYAVSHYVSHRVVTASGRYMHGKLCFNTLLSKEKVFGSSIGHRF